MEARPDFCVIKIVKLLLLLSCSSSDSSHLLDHRLVLRVLLVRPRRLDNAADLIFQFTIERG